MTAGERDPRLHAPERALVLEPLLRGPMARAGAGIDPLLYSLAALVAAAVAAMLLIIDQAVAGGIVILAAALLDTLAGSSPRRAGATAAVVDGLAGRYGDTLMLGGAAVLAHTDGGGAGALLAGGTALAGCVVLAYAGARVRASAGDAAAMAVFGWSGRDLRLIVLAAGVVAGVPIPALIAVAILATLPVLVALVRLRRLVRDG